MHARTYVCISCRWARRAVPNGGCGGRTRLRCPRCRGSLWELGWRWRIPPKRDEEGWRQLDQKVGREALSWLPTTQQAGAQVIAKLDEEIEWLEGHWRSAQGHPRLAELRARRAEAAWRYGCEELICRWEARPRRGAA